MTKRKSRPSPIPVEGGTDGAHPNTGPVPRYTGNAANDQRVALQLHAVEVTVKECAEGQKKLYAQRGEKSGESRRQKNVERDRRIHDARLQGDPLEAIASAEGIKWVSTVLRVLRKPRP